MFSMQVTGYMVPDMHLYTSRAPVEACHPLVEITIYSITSTYMRQTGEDILKSDLMKNLNVALACDLPT